MGRSPGRWLQLLAAAHVDVGIAVYRVPLKAMAGDKLVAPVPLRGERATAFWS